MKQKRAVVLLSGGVDSSTCLAFAAREGFELFALTFNYSQRHSVELDAARRVAAAFGVARHIVMDFDLSLWGGSALTSPDIAVPSLGTGPGEGIPVTYVPARNTIFLSFAAGLGEAVGARDIFIGVNSIDYSNYPDCRPAFIEAFERCVNLGTKACDEGWRFKIHSPLQSLSKAEIIRLGAHLGLDYSLTHSCYNPNERGEACGKCDSCVLRKKGFAEAGIPDPTKYQS